MVEQTVEARYLDIDKLKSKLAKKFPKTKDFRVKVRKCCHQDDPHFQKMSLNVGRLSTVKQAGIQVTKSQSSLRYAIRSP